MGKARGREGKARERESGRASGRDVRAALEGKMQIARGLKVSGMELEQIAIITGLTFQELEGL
jgi:predicted transposase YdaD